MVAQFWEVTELKETLVKSISVIPSGAELPVFVQFCEVEGPRACFAALDQSFPRRKRGVRRNRTPRSIVPLNLLFERSHVDLPAGIDPRVAVEVHGTDKGLRLLVRAVTGPGRAQAGVARVLRRRTGRDVKVRRRCASGDGGRGRSVFRRGARCQRVIVGIGEDGILVLARCRLVRRERGITLRVQLERCG